MKELKRKFKILLGIIGCLVLALCLYVQFMIHDHDRTVFVGSKMNTEQYILGEIVAQLIESHSNLKVKRRFNLGGTNICFSALKTGNIDLYLEYTGTAILEILKQPLPQGDLFEYVKDHFSKNYHLVWLDHLGFSNSYGLIVRADQKIKRISDLENQKSLKFGFSDHFLSRLELDLLKKDYPELSDRKIRQMDEALLYYTLQKRGIDVISGSTTDGRLLNKKLTMLLDDRKCFPAYEVAPLVREDLLKKFPKLHSILAKLQGKITKEEICQMNYLVELENAAPKKVARDFLRKKDLL